MGMILSDNITHYPRGFLIGPVPPVSEIRHGVQSPSVNRLQSIPYIWNCASYNHAHRIFHVGFLHLGFYRYRYVLLEQLIHNLFETFLSIEATRNLLRGISDCLVS